MSKVCIICKQDYWRGNYEEPPEPCWCGEMASGTLWNWAGFDSYLKWSKYCMARFCFWLGSKIIYREY